MARIAESWCARKYKIGTKKSRNLQIPTQFGWAPARIEIIVCSSSYGKREVWEKIWCKDRCYARSGFVSTQLSKLLKIDKNCRIRAIIHHSDRNLWWVRYNATKKCHNFENKMIKHWIFGNVFGSCLDANLKSVRAICSLLWSNLCRVFVWYVMRFMFVAQSLRGWGSPGAICGDFMRAQKGPGAICQFKL